MESLFKELGIEDSIIAGLEKVGITNPTDIQKSVIPHAIENKDIIGQSKTGTGKTLAYLLPIFQRVNSEKREMQALVLAPTHELVVQVQKEIEILSSNSNKNVRSIAIIGEANINRQIDKLKEKPHIIVGTSGRVLELIKRKKIAAHTIKTIVIDEADRLLDRNNLESIKAVIKTTLRDRQIMMFSATVSEKTVQIAKEIMKEPELIRVESKDKVNQDITHYCFVCDQRDKFETLRKVIRSVEPERAIVFINKSDDIEIITEKLKFHKLKAEGIHGTNIRQDRQNAMESFKAGRVNILVASDIAARGLDIKGVTHIFNLDMPEDPKDYLHRVGRTGRAGEAGMAFSIATERELSLVKKYEKVFNIEIEEKAIYKGKIVDIK